ncbi:hypothetical protein [Rivularia sp. UHCC 0363]|uniref:hypothetical protein n=1 Tax=Rivularia sp. UHCC 0363 TaxID=3110244 RepID=UPI002B1EB899|nr:hypothetical protein [Rivularia sp. UHCC 0363]MEA5595908.1 hypothetical protein [Rivularia sp. UHCC 0363]
MASNQLQHAIGVFSSHQHLVEAFNELRNSGFPMNKISAIAKKPQLDDADTSESNIASSEGAVMGAIAGARVGGLLTLVAGLGALLIPGFGPILAVESVLVTLLGSGATAAAGGLIGALQGWFLPEEAALLYNNRVCQGNYLVTIEAIEDDIRRAEPVLSRWGIQDWRVVDVPTS